MGAWLVDWWLWIVLGLGLLGLELLLPSGFYLTFFGVAAVLVGLLAAVGIAGSLGAQLLQFTLLSLACLFGLRRLLLTHLRPSKAARNVDALVGETALALDDVPVNGLGRAELRGSSWSVRNVGDAAVARGQRCVVERVDGLTLWVRGHPQIPGGATGPPPG